MIRFTYSHVLRVVPSLHLDSSNFQVALFIACRSQSKELKIDQCEENTGLEKARLIVHGQGVLDGGVGLYIQPIDANRQNALGGTFGVLRDSRHSLGVGVNILFVLKSQYINTAEYHVR